MIQIKVRQFVATDLADVASQSKNALNRRKAESQTLQIANVLAACATFAGLPEPDLLEIACFAAVRELRKGEYLFREGRPSEGLYIARQGAISVHRVSAGGKVQVLHVFRRNESFGEAALLTREGYPAQARALMLSSVILLPTAKFLTLMRKRPELALRMLASVSDHVRILVALLDDVTLKDVQARCIHWLLKQRGNSAHNEPVAIQLDRPKRILAAEMNIAGETLSRALAKLRKQGLIHVAGNTIVLKNPQRLEAALRRHLGEA